MKSFNPAKVLERRKALGKTRQVLARETGLSSASIFYIEKGRKVPKADTLSKLADALKCEVDYFFAD